MQQSLFATVCAPVDPRHRDPKGILSRKCRKASSPRPSNCSIAASRAFRTSGTCEKRTSRSPPSGWLASARAAALGRAGGPQLRPNVRVVGETMRGGARAGSKPSDRFERNMQSKALREPRRNMPSDQPLPPFACAAQMPSPQPLPQFAPLSCTHPFTIRFVVLPPFTRKPNTIAFFSPET